MFRQIRRLHTVPRLSVDAAKGIPGLFSPQAFQIAWTDHQTDLVKRLNAAVVDTDNETRSPFHIILNAGSRLDLSHVFNYASQLYNNHMFFSGLTLAEGSSVPSQALARRLEVAFGSIENLREKILAASETIHANGWVFLVETGEKKLEVVACNNAGSPFHYGRQQSIDLSGPVDEDSLLGIDKATAAVTSKTKNHNIALLALNLWQHAYVPDFGVGGRSKYIDAWWSKIDWNQVSMRLFR